MRNEINNNHYKEYYEEMKKINDLMNNEIT
jgi:hypothetical protein